MIRGSRALPLVLFLLLAAWPPAAQARPQENAGGVPAPRLVLGFDPGEDRKLASWSQVVEYFKRLDAASDRVQVHQAGLSTLQRPFIYALISAPENLADLDSIRAAQRRLADPRLIESAAERERLIRETPAVVAITCTIHSTEVGATLMATELAHRLAVDDAPATREILKNVVLVLVPSVNPDGVDIVADWYRKTLGTKFEGTQPPELYHHYTGHDNNRDWFMLTQVETQLVSRLFWREWFPEIVYDVHQQGQFGSRMCVPPFFDPHNPNIDPLIVRQTGLIGMRMATQLTAAGFRGVVTNSTYDMWWHGGLRSAPYYHNAIGILTEAASARLASPLEVRREQLRQPTRGLADPLQPAINFPAPWPGGTWRLRDIIEMELVTCRTALEEAATRREELIRNFVTLGERAIEKGKTEAPYAYIVPADQHDRPTADRMINILIEQGVEVHQATGDFTADGRTYGKGSYVVLLAQPYRANVKCLFEPQKYPDRRLYPGGPAEAPYDVAGWTLPMQMGVAYAEAGKPFEAALEKIESARTPQVQPLYGSAKAADSPSPATLYLAPGKNQVYAFLNEAWRLPETVSISRLKADATVDGKTLRAGGFLIDYTPRKVARRGRGAAAEQPNGLSLAALFERAGRHGIGADLMPVGEGRKNPARTLDRVALQRPRVALYRGWANSMDEGWTRWVLEQFGFEFTSLMDADVRAGNLNDRFDVVILPDISMTQLVEGNRAGSYPDEYTGGLTEAGVANLRRFVEAGGVLVCLNSSSELAIKRFGLPVTNALENVSRSEFYAPGSIFRARVDTSHPLAYGMPGEADLYFVSGTRRAPAPEAAPGVEAAARRQTELLVSAWAFEIGDPARARSVARYVEGNPLRSGWLLGPERVAGKSALVDVSLGKGRVVLFGFRTQHRGQTWGTFRFLFNAILLGGQR